MLKVALGFFHVELLAEAEIAKDIEYQMVDFVGHVKRLGPFSIGVFPGLVFNQVQPSVKVLVDERLHALQGLVGECIVEDTALASVGIDISAVPDIDNFDAVTLKDGCQ